MRRWRAWRGDRRGVAAVEFALVIPALMIVYLGGYEITQAMSVYRKVSDTTVELANIVAQSTSVNTAGVTAMEAVSSQIMTPDPTVTISILVTEVNTNASNTATVAWSVPYGGATKLAIGSAYTLPTGMSQASTSYIVVQVSYSFVPIYGSFVGVANSIPLSGQLIMLPRQSSTIACSDCT